MTQERLIGRTVLITGASSGLGERFARICAREGAAVVIGARRADRLETLAKELEGEGKKALAVKLDVTDEQSVIAAYDQAEQKFGTVDCVVANAGIEASGPATELSVEDFDRVFAVNVRGTFLTAREGKRRMDAASMADRGRIVLISSITARIHEQHICAYASSKAAVRHLAGLLAREWARTGPAVNSISPGYISTELTEEWFATEGGLKQVKKFPRRRLVDEDAMDEILITLLSGAAKNITGSDFTIDDGQSL